MAEVRLQEGESLENALRRFKRKVMTEDIIKEIKRHSFYLKPGERRRVKQALAQKRARKKILLCFDQFVDQVRRRGETYSPFLTARRHAQSRGQVRLAGAALAH